MANGTENRDETPKPAAPGFKRFTGAKLVPLPAPIAQANDKESFPVFLGAGIALSMLVLIIVFILSFTTTKRQTHPQASPTPGEAMRTSAAHQ